MSKDQEESPNAVSHERRKLDHWRRTFGSAASKWRGMIPSGPTISRKGFPTYLVKAPRDGDTDSLLPQSDAEWVSLGWTFTDVKSEDGTLVRRRSERPEPNRTSPLAAAARDLRKTCRAFAHGDEDVIPLVRDRIQSTLQGLAEQLAADPDPATFEQTQAVREVERLLNQNAEFRHRIDTEGIPELELVRLDLKRDRVEHGWSDLPSAYSLWQETTDLLTRTNLHASARVQELFFLRVIASRLAAFAQERQMPRAALQSLQVRLQMLMPREWFHDPDTREHVLDEICRANVEVEELMRANAKVQRTKTTTAGVTGDLVTLRQLAIETSISYTTLNSRRLRMPKENQPRPQGKDEQRLALFLRSDWDPIVGAIRARRTGA